MPVSAPTKPTQVVILYSGILFLQKSKQSELIQKYQENIQLLNAKKEQEQEEYNKALEAAKQVEPNKPVSVLRSSRVIQAEMTSLQQKIQSDTRQFGSRSMDDVKTQYLHYRKQYEERKQILCFDVIHGT